MNIFGFPVKTARPIESMIAEKFGRLISVHPPYAFYEYQGKIFIGSAPSDPKDSSTTSGT